MNPTPESSDGDDFVMLPPPTNGGRRILASVAIVVLLVGIVIGSALVWGSRQINPSGPPGELVESLVIPSGSSTARIGEILAGEGIISSARVFGYYVGWKNEGPWKAGEYLDFRTNSSFDEAISILDQGPVPPAATVVRVAEGSRLVDALAGIADQVGTVTAEELQAALDSGVVVSKYKPAGVTSWEGLLFPDTYQFDEAASPEEIMQRMVTKMDSVLDELGYGRAQTVQGRTAYDLITIASLIEKETGAPAEERAKISRVISNRLDADMTLGIDASVLYGLGRTSGELTKSDLETETPYNNRLVKGLPPTPIALPGRASLEAAISPVAGDWKYYVLTSNDPPSHVFVETYDEFLAERDDARDRGVF